MYLPPGSAVINPLISRSVSAVITFPTGMSEFDISSAEMAHEDREIRLVEGQAVQCGQALATEHPGQGHQVDHPDHDQHRRDHVSH